MKTLTAGAAGNRIWAQAAEIDRTIRVTGRHCARLDATRLHPTNYSRHRLFEGMSEARISLFRNLRLPGVGGDSNVGTTCAGMILRGFGEHHRARVRTGRKGVVHHMPVRHMVERWQRARSILTVTDLHVRGTRFARQLNLDPLSTFNLLLHGTTAMARQEMMTMVISSAGSMTDSHSDDPDGSNHCFVGTKLWLVWETFEGQRAGLQDVERDRVYDRAAFDMDTFLSLDSARWFLVSTGETLFLPGQLTHKVLTLEPYLGIGSFYVSLPNCIGTLARWIRHGPLWSRPGQDPTNDALLRQIANTAATRIDTLRRQTKSAQDQWGLGFLARSVRAWRRRHDAGVRAALVENPVMAELAASIERVVPRGLQS